MGKKFLLFILGVCTSTFIFSQDLSGNWSGVIFNSGQDLEKADVIYLKIGESGDNITGLSRIERSNNQEEFAVKSFNGEKRENKLTLSEDYIRRSSKSRQSPECKLNYELTYNESTAYLKGSFISSDCRHQQGEIVLFRSDHEVTTEKEPIASHLWKQYFVRNYKKGYPAPEIMKLEQANFEFQVIHFDYDKAEIKPEYFDYLNKMARVLDGIHDLRVKITGHTDADGTDDYNMELSEERAQAIRDYFKKQGIDPEKFEIDFKGKRQPVDSNNTKEGMRKNRRVVFKFI